MVISILKGCYDYITYHSSSFFYNSNSVLSSDLFKKKRVYGLITGRNALAFAKDTVYHFMKMIQINWIRFTTILFSKIIGDAVLSLDSQERANVLVLDDFIFDCSRSEKVELLTKLYDHAKHRYRFGFRILTLGWSDGSAFLPVNSILLSSEK